MTTRLAAAVADLFGPISRVVEEAEALVSSEARTSAYYREHPDLLFPGHPWWALVRSGAAEWLGWSRDEAPPPRRPDPLVTPRGWVAPREVVILQDGTLRVLGDS